MKTSHPERVHVSRQPENGYWYGNMAVLANGRQTAFTFSYWRPFLQPHSISLGARGIVNVDTIGESNGIGASVEIIKGSEPNGLRNEGNYFPRFYTYDDLEEASVPRSEHNGKVLPAELGYMLPNQETAKAIAKLAVADSLVEYSARESWMIDLIKGVLDRQQTTT